LKILKSNTAESYSRENERKNVDSGNILQRATEITIALISSIKDNSEINAKEVLKESCKVCTEQFLEIKKMLEAPEKSDINEQGEYE
jgi:hypothetical protein